MREKLPPASAGTAVPAPERSPTETVGPLADPRVKLALWASLALAVGAFFPTLIKTGWTWWNNPEYSHGILMPIVAFWLLWENKDHIRTLKSASSLAALPVLLLGIAGLLVGKLDYMNSLAPFAFVGVLAGIVLAYFSWQGLRAFGPALVVLLLSCPLPGAVQSALTLPLKEISSSFAVGLLQISGIPTYLEGAMIHLEGTDSLWVADACSGIRSFISLLSIAVIACLIWQRHWALKLAVVLAAVPIAVLVNGFRIWLTGYLSVHVGPEAAEGAFHFFEGFALFALAGLILLGFAWLLGLLFPRAES